MAKAEAERNSGAATRASLAVVLTAVLWSTSGLCIKLIDWNPFVIAGSRSFIAALVILAYLRRPVFTFSFIQVAAAFAQALTMILFVVSVKLTTAANAILIQYCSPVLVAVLGWLILKERPRREHWIGLVLISAGIVIFFMEEVSAGSRLGDLLALASGFTSAMHVILVRKQKDGSSTESFLLGHILAFLVALPFMVMYPPQLTIRAAGTALYLGVFQIGVTSLLFAYGLKHIPGIQAMLIATLEPILNPVWVFLLVGERPSASAIAGGLVIIVSVTFCLVVSGRRNAREQRE